MSNNFVSLLYWDEQSCPWPLVSYMCHIFMLWDITDEIFFFWNQNNIFSVLDLWFRYVKDYRLDAKKSCTILFSWRVQNILNNLFYHFRNYKLSLTIALSRLPTLCWWSDEIPWHTLVTSLLGLNGYVCFGMVVIISWKISSGWKQCFSCKRDTFRPFDRSDAHTCNTGWRGRKVEWYKTPGSWWSKSCTPDVRRWRLRPKLRHLLHLVANQEHLSLCPLRH